MTKPKPVTIDGVEYESQVAAARVLGISPQLLWQRLHSEYRRGIYPHTRAERNTLLRRWIKASEGDVELASILLPLFPHCKTIDDLFAYALHELAKTTGD